ncbi:NAD(P)-binding domain-containing protein [Pseudomonas wenzhouensis]|nr:NAD(P)-binding domain-containing protein [Pseudomonas wenzhouensis]MDM9654081.1 NAD(P)-binding domain-containing protein [Pseudomonas wenzhouensis]
MNTSVDKVFKRDDGRWLVTLSGGEQHLYRAVVCATGCSWDANMPEVKGQFNGEIRHSVTYKKAEELKGKKVMIIGAGNSGADIACDAATPCAEGHHQPAPWLPQDSQAPVRPARR